jgi:hypothetical protein
VLKRPGSAITHPSAARQLVLAALGLLLFACISAPPRTPVPTPLPTATPTVARGFRLYEDAEWGFRFSYPAQWGMFKTPDYPDGVVMVGRNNVDGVVIEVYKLTQAVTPADLLNIKGQMEHDLASQLRDFMLFDSRIVNVNGFDGVDITYTFTQNDTKLRKRIVAVFKDDRQFNINCQASSMLNYYNLEQQFATVVSSFQITYVRK